MFLKVTLATKCFYNLSFMLLFIGWFVEVGFCLVGFYEAPSMYNKEQEISNELLKTGQNKCFLARVI